MHFSKKIIINCMAMLCLLVFSAPIYAEAGQIPVREEISSYEIIPDLLASGTNDEQNNITYHKLLLSAIDKDNGLIIKLTVPSKGRIHYSVGVDTIASAAIIQPEVYEDPECSVLIKNNYESDDVLNHFYNFDVKEPGDYYLMLTAPEYDLEEELPIDFSAQFYDGSDRILEEGMQEEALAQTGERSLAPIFLSIAIVSLGIASVIGINE